MGSCCRWDIGFRGIVGDLMTSYLKDREQYVKIDSTCRKNIVEYGVPQGTVLGSVLFIIYMNCILNVESAGEISSFADDTVVFYEDETWENLKGKVETDLDHLIDAFSDMFLTVNFNKTFFWPSAVLHLMSPNMIN
ncbi:hypothetical protein WA026_012542 [Henosepilachna vigintioctopunctata]|uniref:Reverse transcriptase domain-containing protein n=1 Tax=Henosepilachna vigintioctopunctata TaxID=420089 RepID=A0AAW1U6C5_9CUCU